MSDSVSVLLLLLQLSCHSVAVVPTPVQTEQIGINIHKRNNTKTQYKQYKNTVHAIQNTVHTIQNSVHTIQNTVHKYKTQYIQYKTQYINTKHNTNSTKHSTYNTKHSTYNTKHSTNSTKHCKYKYTHYQNTHTLQNKLKRPQYSSCLFQVCRDKLVTVDVRRTHSQGFSVHFQKVHTDRSYDCTPCAPLHGRYEVSLAVATPWRLQLCVLLVSAASKEPVLYCTICCIAPRIVIEGLGRLSARNAVRSLSGLNGRSLKCA